MLNCTQQSVWLVIFRVTDTKTNQSKSLSFCRHPSETPPKKQLTLIIPKHINKTKNPQVTNQIIQISSKNVKKWRRRSTNQSLIWPLFHDFSRTPLSTAGHSPFSGDTLAGEPLLFLFFNSPGHDGLLPGPDFSGVVRLLILGDISEFDDTWISDFSNWVYIDAMDYWVGFDLLFCRVSLQFVGFWTVFPLLGFTPPRCSCLETLMRMKWLVSCRDKFWVAEIRLLYLFHILVL